MCGIFGILQHNTNSVPDAARLQQTADALQHRGPDGRGIYSETGIGLVHTRLALVDLSERSNQPLWDRTRRYCLVYNGELYGYEDLKQRLRRRGVVFQTSSDTEVLLEALIHFGLEPTLRLLEGMFAFGLYDAREGVLVVARDRLGIKPLHVYEGQHEFIFASTPQAFRPWLTLRPNLLSAASYLLGFGAPTVGDSFYDRIEILPPGVVLRVRVGGRTERARFSMTQERLDADEAKSLAAEKPGKLLDQIDELLSQSVKSQLNAEAPMGVLCSGGVDSSIIAAMASKFRQDLTIFHADVEGQFSERGAASELAELVKLEFKSVAVRDRDFIERLPDVIEHYGFPFTFHTASIALLKVAELARRSGAKAVLCGEGADECYFGYPWLAPTGRARFRLPAQSYRTLPSWLRQCGRLIRAKLALPPISAGDRTVLQGIDRQVKSELGESAFDAWSGAGWQSARARRRCVLEGVLAYVLRTLLHRNDSLGMAASVEARFPFLDSRLLRFAEKLPDAYKIRFSPLSIDREHPFFCDKWIVRQLAKRYLPKSFSQRKKQPFRTDADQHMRISPRFFADSYLADLLQLTRAGLQQMIEAADHALQLRFLHFDVWEQICLRQIPKEVVIRRLRDHVVLLRPARRMQ
jgi:asparagine synthase (glutamine-hydrolysing)